MLVARTHVTVADPATLAAKMCDHFSEGGAFITKEGGAWVVTFDFGAGTLTAAADGLTMVAEADDAVEMYNLRWMLAEHLLEFLDGPEPDFIWEGDGSEMSRPPYFRLMQVAAVEDVSPHMRRLRLRGDDLDRFATDEELHIKLYIPRSTNVEPEWPSVRPNGIPHFPSGPGAAIMRRYTIRAIDPEAGTVDVDFVIHDDAGPGSSFAANARVGDVVGMTGPGGSSIPVDKDWYLLAGDETALPAIARILEFLPAAASGLALIEVSNEAERQEIETRSAIEIRWLYRESESRKGLTLSDDVQQVKHPGSTSSAYVWMAGEFGDFKRIRSHVKSEWRLRKDQHLIVSYWRRGEVEDNRTPLEQV